MKILPPRTIFITGMSCAGKSTICNEMIRKISNAFPLRRNDVIWSMMHVDVSYSGESSFSGEQNELPPFEDYVARDAVFPDNARLVETPFGKLLQVMPRNAFYARHASPQSYLVLAKIAGAGLALDKIPVLDRFLAKHIESGTLGKYLNLPFFQGFPKFLLHFVADPEVCYERFLQRQESENQWDAARRDVHNLSKEMFVKNFALKEKSPQGLERIPHLTIDTTFKTPPECIEECLSYVGGDINQI